MSPSTAVTLIALLVAVLLIIVAVMVWQEGKTKMMSEGRLYVVEDAVDFICRRLDEGTLRRSDVKRIIEWEVHYLQGLAQPNRHNPVEVVAGGAAAAVEYIAAEIADKHGVAYSHDDIHRVLELEASYLESIGAVGDPVEDESPGGEDR